MGCGKGQACVDVARRSGAEVTGLDLSTSNIQRARECLGCCGWLGMLVPCQVMKRFGIGRGQKASRIQDLFQNFDTLW